MHLSIYIRDVKYYRPLGNEYIKPNIMYTNNAGMVNCALMHKIMYVAIELYLSYLKEMILLP